MNRRKLGIALVGGGKLTDITDRIDHGASITSYGVAAHLAQGITEQAPFREKGVVCRVIDRDTGEPLFEDWTWLLPLLQLDAGLPVADRVFMMLDGQEGALRLGVSMSHPQDRPHLAALVIDPLDDHGVRIARLLDLPHDRDALVREQDRRRDGGLPVHVLVGHADGLSRRLGIPLPVGAVALFGCGGGHIVHGKLPIGSVQVATA